MLDHKTLTYNIKGKALYEFPFHCQLPKEMGSYVTLIRPFDEYTWILAFVASTIFYLTLVVMEPLWTAGSGSPCKSDCLYQGINLSICTVVFGSNFIVCLFYHDWERPTRS